MFSLKCSLIIVLFFVSLVSCDFQEDDMSVFRFSTKNSYNFKPVAKYYDANLFTPRKVWAIYRYL